MNPTSSSFWRSTEPPEIRKNDLLLVDRSAGKRLPRGEGLYVFSVPTGLAVRRVQVGIRKGFVVTGPGISEELEPMEIDRLLVGSIEPDPQLSTTASSRSTAEHAGKVLEDCQTGLAAVMSGGGSIPRQRTPIRPSAFSQYHPGVCLRAPQSTRCLCASCKRHDSGPFAKCSGRIEGGPVLVDLGDCRVPILRKVSHPLVRCVATGPCGDAVGSHGRALTMSDLWAD